jgi:hypothetical protein
LFLLLSLSPAVVFVVVMFFFKHRRRVHVLVLARYDLIGQLANLIHTLISLANQHTHIHSHRNKHCFVSHDSSIGYWIRLGNLISRIEGFDPHQDDFLVRDYDDKSYLLTRDGRAFHPISDREASDIMNRTGFRSVVTFHDFDNKSPKDQRAASASAAITGSGGESPLLLHSLPASSASSHDAASGGSFSADHDFVYLTREADVDGEPETRVIALWSSPSSSSP